MSNVNQCDKCKKIFKNNDWYYFCGLRQAQWLHYCVDCVNMSGLISMSK